MLNKKTAAYLGVSLAACILILAGQLLDSLLRIGDIFSVVAKAAVALGALIWLTWHGTRPAAKRGFLRYAWLGLIPAALHIIACFGPLNAAKLPLDFIWGGINTLLDALWQALLLLGVGGSLLISEGKVTAYARGAWIASFAFSHLVGMIATPAMYANHLLGAMVALAMGAFLTVVYENSGKLWMVILLPFAYEISNTIFSIGSRNFAYLGGAVYYCILICNIMLYAVGAVYLARHANGKPKA
jgi:hypothetical protein